MSALLIGGPFAILIALAACCFRISAWHSAESRYWYRVAALVQLNPTLDVTYRPILDWARANRPGVWERLAGWRSPEDRMSRAPLAAAGGVEQAATGVRR